MLRIARFPTALLIVPLALAACRQQDSASEQNFADNAATNLPSVPAPEPPVDRAALLAAVAQAASSAAAGEAYPESLKRLEGREFEVRIRFGCRGASTDLSSQWLGWSYQPEQRTLRVRARPTISGDEPLAAAMGGEEVESIEGFWIPRPWLLVPVCPATAAVQPPGEADSSEGEDVDAAAGEAAPATYEALPAAPRVGIAQFFTSAHPRTRRRDSRAYEAVKTLPEGAPISSQGFNLVLSGRLRALPGKGAIACLARNAQSPPECIVSAEFYRVWIEQPDTREVIAEWGSG